ncbi:MAG: signal peptidase II [Bacilli bacterium]|nr:signal peptidase II [Bacilli bacterium]
MVAIISLILILVSLDQLTKFFAVKYLTVENEYILKIPFIRFYLTYNTGAALGILQSHGVLLAIIKTIAFSVFGFLLYRDGDLVNNAIYTISLIFLISGTLGNLTCRLIRRKVVDFLMLSFNRFSTPIFNLADLYVLIGLITFIITQLL